MHVAFNGRQQHFSGRCAFLFTCLNERFEVGHGLLHDACGFNHLRQEHFAVTKQIADHVHPVHQRTFDHLNRAIGLKTSLFGI